MGIKLEYDLTIEQTQKLVMTPELIQAIQILQFNTQELNAYIDEQLLVNPVLEHNTAEETDAGSGEAHELHGEHFDESRDAREKTSHDKDEDFDWKQYIRDRQYDDISYRQHEYRGDDDKDNDYERYVSSDVTLPENLMFQLQFTDLGGCGRRIGRYIIESLDENGYMTSTTAEIASALGVSEDDVLETLEVIHTFEPAGVGAADLKECLMIQLHQRGQLTELFARVIQEHLEDLASNRLTVIARDTGISTGEVQEMCDIIRTLEPKPGRQFASEMETKYIIPDVIVEKSDDEYTVTINDSSTPRLVVSSYYQKLLGEAEKDDQLSKYLSERINSAIWLIKSIEQRKQTIFNVVSAIVKYQRGFFDKGSKYMRTLTLKDIAEEVGIHESTVSRSINGKYLQCCRGVFEIKYFFSAGVSGSRGEGISSYSIKEFIKEIVESEDPKSPYSDQDMADMLQEKGIRISRRTVAKYRDEMDILSSSKRKRY